MEHQPTSVVPPERGTGIHRQDSSSSDCFPKSSCFPFSGSFPEDKMEEDPEDGK